MRELKINLDDEDRTLIERVQVRRGFETLDEAVEWLVKQHLRRARRATGGQGTTLFLVQGPTPDEGRQ